MKTVALYTDARGFGGAEVQLLSLAQHLDRRLFRPVVLYSDGIGLAPFAARLATLGIEAHHAPPLTDAGQLANVPRLASLLRRLGVDVFHAQKSYPPACRFGLLAALLARCRVVVSTDQLRYPWPPSRRRRMFLRALSACMDAHIAVSRSVGHQLVDVLGFRRDKIRVIPNWVSPDDFVVATDGHDVRRTLGLSPSAVVVGCVARFHPQKAHDELVAAAATLVPRHPELVFLLVGEGETRHEIETLVARSQLAAHVRFLGLRHDVPELLHAMDVLVLPSRWEGLPVSVLEAMAAGKPVVATAVDGTTEAVDDGTTGLLVPPGDVAALTQALGRLITEPVLRTSMGAAGRRRVHERFAVKPLVRETETVYLGAVA